MCVDGVLSNQETKTKSVSESGHVSKLGESWHRGVGGGGGGGGDIENDSKKRERERERERVCAFSHTHM